MLKKRELQNLGLVSGAQRDAARGALAQAQRAGHTKDHVRQDLKQVLAAPEGYREDPLYGELARQLTRHLDIVRLPQESNAPLRVWGEAIEEEALQQIETARRLPVAVAAALMPDAHLGYGLPIGGVLATEEAVIPYAVGVDIGCRVMVTVTDIAIVEFEKNTAKFSRALENRTRFGKGVQWALGERREHEVLDRDWHQTQLTENLKDLAWKQLGTSGSGNHFVEFGEIDLYNDLQDAPAGRYLALVSHSGSRGPGASIATHYTRIAKSMHPTLPGKARDLAWLPLTSEAGQEYWYAMELMGAYASANHDIIHSRVLQAVGGRRLARIENHHNFAWRETHHDKEVIVHRKGATPAAEDVLGYIPGTMVDPGYLVEGLGHNESLDSCSHGAGRAMSRRQAKKSSTWHSVKKTLRERKVTLLSSGLDEAPHAYKDIDQVMAAQRELARVIGKFQPRLVKMAPEGEKPED